MNEDALDHVIRRLINDLSTSFPAPEFPATASAIGRLRLTYEREMVKKHVLRRADLSLSDDQSDRVLDFPIVMGPTDEQTS